MRSDSLDKAIIVNGRIHALVPVTKHGNNYPIKYRDIGAWASKVLFWSKILEPKESRWGAFRVNGEIKVRKI